MRLPRVPHLLPLLALAAALPAATAPAPAATAPAARAPEPSAEDVAELRTTFAAGDCAAVTAKAKKLAAKFPSSPEPLIYIANCLSRAARKVERVFDDLAYDRARLGSGLLPAQSADAMYRTVVTRDPAKTAEALATFRKALDLAPARADLVVGNVAALAMAGRADEAAALLRERRDAVDERAQADVGRTVLDLVRLDDMSGASTLAAALDASFPGSDAALRTAGALAIARHDTVGGLERMTALVRQHPDDVALATDAARLQLYTRRWAEAVNTLVPHASESDERLFWLGLARSRVNAASAVPVFQELVKRLAERKEAAPLLEVAQHYARALADPRRPNVAMRLRAANRFAKAGLPIAAVTELDDALAQDPLSVEALKRLADIYREVGLPDLGAEALAQAIAVAARTPDGSAFPAAELQVERGRALLGAERDADAAAAFAAARAAGQPAPYEEALAQLGLGDRAAARRLFEEAAAAGGENAERARTRLAQP